MLAIVLSKRHISPIECSACTQAVAPGNPPDRVTVYATILGLVTSITPLNMINRALHRWPVLVFSNDV